MWCERGVDGHVHVHVHVHVHAHAHVHVHVHVHVHAHSHAHVHVHVHVHVMLFKSLFFRVLKFIFSVEDLAILLRCRGLSSYTPRISWGDVLPFCRLAGDSCKNGRIILTQSTASGGYMHAPRARARQLGVRLF